MKNIVIVGGGISGMIASINLKKKAPQYNIILIEKETQIMALVGIGWMILLMIFLIKLVLIKLLTL